MSTNDPNYGQQGDDSGNELDISAAVSGEILKWRQQVAAARSAIDRYMRSDEFALTTGKECGSADADTMSEAVEDFVIIPAFRVIRNSDPSLLFRPALVVGTFDPRIEVITHAAALADFLGGLYGAEEPDDPEVKALWDIVHDDHYAPKKRTLIPEPTSGGFQIYVFAVLLVGHDPGGEEAGIIGFLTSPPPGPAILIHIPAQVLAGRPHAPMNIPGVSQQNPPRRPSSPRRPGQSVRPRTPVARSAQGGGIFRSVWFWVLAGLFLIGLIGRIINGPTGGRDKDRQNESKPLNRPK